MNWRCPIDKTSISSNIYNISLKCVARLLVNEVCKMITPIKVVNGHFRLNDYILGYN